MSNTTLRRIVALLLLIVVAEGVLVVQLSQRSQHDEIKDLRRGLDSLCGDTQTLGFVVAHHGVTVTCPP